MLKKITASILAASALAFASFTAAPVWGQFNWCLLPDGGGGSTNQAFVEVTEYDPIVAFVDVTILDASNVVLGGASFTMHPSNYNTGITFSAAGRTHILAPNFGETWGGIGQGSCLMSYASL